MCCILFCGSNPQKTRKNEAFFDKILRKRMMNMNREIDPGVYIDPQTQPPADFCPVCGCERYLPGLHCVRCEGGVV